MNERRYQLLKATAIAMAIAWVAWSVYDFMRAKAPGDFAYHAASNYFADGDYARALQEYQTALQENPEHFAAQRGMAETLILLEREPEAIALYQDLLKLDVNNASAYANMGIAYDRLGRHEQALQNYQKALSIDPELVDGPGWLTRFFRNQYEKPPGIAERAEYLRQQLALPEDQRILRWPDQDDAQQPYKN